MVKVACAHPGKIGDALYALPTARALSIRHGSPVDFYTSEHCRPLLDLFEWQSCVSRAYVLEEYVPTRLDCGVQPWEMSVPAGYDFVYQLGYRTIPNGPLPNFIAESAELPPQEVRYEFPATEPPGFPYIVIAPRGETGFAHLFRELTANSPIKVVEVGALTEGVGGTKSIDMTGLSPLDTLSWIANSQGFVGLMSAMLVLANGFDIPKVAPHDGKSWDMNHVINSPTNHYPVNPTASQVLQLLGLP